MKRSGLYNNAIFIQCKTSLSNFEDFIPAFKTCYLMNENHETGSACKSSALWVMQMCRWKALSFVTSSLKIQNHHHFKLGKKKNKNKSWRLWRSVWCDITLCNLRPWLLLWISVCFFLSLCRLVKAWIKSNKYKLHVNTTRVSI